MQLTPNTPPIGPMMNPTLQAFGPVLVQQDIAELSAETGAYILHLHVEDAIEISVGRLGTLLFAPGLYHYFGSAYGPGGIKARVARHMQTEHKRPHWHIDCLRQVVGIHSAHVFPGHNECALVAQFSKKLNLTVPFHGFGSSDCKVCGAHLLMQAR